MIDPKDINNEQASKISNVLDFLEVARSHTYAGSGGKVTPVLNGSKQLEFSDKKFLYRDIFYTGKNTFVGIETVYEESLPIFAMSYYGNWTTMTENETDTILREALISNPLTRLTQKIEWAKNGYKYSYLPNNKNKIGELGGEETITLNGKLLYWYSSSGSFLQLMV